MRLIINTILLISLLLVLTNCQQKDVKLPIINSSGIQDTIYNNSAIWIFYSVKDNDTLAELNRNNKIENTHWIFNIDRRLALKHIIPHIQKMQEKKAAPSPHDNGEITHMYYSYVDTVANKLSMVLFDSIQYNTTTVFELDSIPNKYKNLKLEYTKTNLSINNTTIALDTLSDFINGQYDTIPLRLHLNLDKNISYGQYIQLKAILAQLKSDTIVIEKTEFVK